MSDRFLGSRTEYSQRGLDLRDLARDPATQLELWIEDAMIENVLEPTAMCLATAGADGCPSSRMVLMRALDQRGLTFFSNFSSQKGMELDANARAAVCFWWGPLQRQVRVEGRVEKVSESESDHYFTNRPRGSQLASAASPQSQPVDSREQLDALVADLDAKFPGEIPRPSHWGGYRLIPESFEFWQGREARLHDRFRYTVAESGWTIQRLAP